MTSCPALTESVVGAGLTAAPFGATTVEATVAVMPRPTEESLTHWVAPWCPVPWLVTSSAACPSSRSVTVTGPVKCGTSRSRTIAACRCTRSGVTS